MKQLLFLGFLILLNLKINSQIKFEDYFEDKTLRIDYFHTGDIDNDSYSIDELKEEPFWGGSKKNLIDKFEFGKYKIEVYDSASNELIYSRGFSTLFGEWQTVKEARTTSKSFSETFVLPYPKKPVRLDFFTRDKKNVFIEKFSYSLNPSDYFISPEQRYKFPSFEVVRSGDPSKSVDIVIIPEGYTAGEMNKFREDCNKFAGYLFNASPFKENKNKFNIWGIEAASQDSGTDIPAKDIWKKTMVNSSFYTFDLERYLMTYDNKSVRDLASNAPYDQIYILVNTKIYGGGSIYNHYSVCVSNNKFEEYIFTHEFGHGFAGLADEYYTSDVAYENFYPLDVEPWEMNITTMADFDLKWKDMIKEGTPVPTPAVEEHKNTLGAFEGGGYVAKGVFRPEMDCTMKSIKVDNFCDVCRKTIQDLIDFHTK